MKLGFAAEFEAGEFMIARVIPGEKLPGCGVVLSGVEIAEQGGGCEPAGAKVENEIDQGVELSLGERHTNEPPDGRFGDGHVGDQDGVGLGRADSERKLLVAR